MTWLDLRTEILFLFADQRIEIAREMRATSKLGLYDPHGDATRWIDATAGERKRLAPVYAERLEEVRKRNALALVRTPRKPWRRDRAVQAERMREYRKRPEARAKDNARSAEWRRKNREKAAAYLREWRKRTAREGRRAA